MNPITSAETDDGLITEPTLHLCLNEHAIRALAEAARKSNLQLIAEQIEAQLPKAPVEEPTGDVTVWAGGEAYTPEGDDRRWLGPGGVERDWSFLAMHDPMIYRRESPEPTPEQVETASAPVGEAAIDALVTEFAPWDGIIQRQRLRAFACRVLEVSGQQPAYPHASGDAVVLGPETIRSADGAVIVHKGQNYYPTPAAAIDRDALLSLLNEQELYAPTAPADRGGLVDAILALQSEVGGQQPGVPVATEGSATLAGLLDAIDDGNLTGTRLRWHGHEIYLHTTDQVTGFISQYMEDNP